MKKNSIKIKIFVAATLILPTVGALSIANKNETKELEMIHADDNMVEELTTEPTTLVESTTTTVESTTTMVTTTTVVTTTEPVDIYKHLRHLELLNNNDLSIEELDSFINKYAGYAKLSYDEALQVINDNIDSIKEYESIRGGIMCTLFSYSNEIGLLSPYTENREIRPDMTQEEKESIMIEFSDNLCMCVDDKYIVLSAFREETGRGISDMCVYNNNYGGIRIYGEAGCNGEYGRYSTPEFGMYREVSLINKKLKSIRENGTNDIGSVVYAFACRYNPDYADHYSGKIMNWVYDVQNDYGDFSNTESYQKVYSN